MKKLLLSAAAIAMASSSAQADTSNTRIALSNNYAGNSWRQAMLQSWEEVGAGQQWVAFELQPRNSVRQRRQARKTLQHPAELALGVRRSARVLFQPVPARDSARRCRFPPHHRAPGAGARTIHQSADSGRWA